MTLSLDQWLQLGTGALLLILLLALVWQSIRLSSRMAELQRRVDH